jgi:hypothetical protein
MIYLKPMELINDYSSKISDLIQNGYRVNIENYLSRGFRIFRSKMDYFLLYTVIFICIWIIPPLACFILLPLMAGFYLTAHYLEKQKPVRFEDMFDGFRHFAGLFLFTLISSILVSLGLLALILPGIYLAVGYVFAPFFIIFGKLEFWEAMKTSRRLVHREWLSVFGFILILGLLNLAGVLALGIGVIFTIPVTYCALYAAFDDIVGINN